MKQALSDFWHWLRRFVSPVTIACLAIVAFVIFYGDNSVFDSIEQDRTVDSLRAELASIQDSTARYREMNSRLLSDPDMMEKVVREQYGMHRQHERVFNFKDPSDR